MTQIVKIRGQSESTFLAAATSLRSDLADLFVPGTRYVNDPDGAWLMVLGITAPWTTTPTYDADGDLVSPGTREAAFLVDILAFDTTQVGGLLTQLAAAGLSATVVSPTNPVHAFA